MLKEINNRRTQRTEQEKGVVIGGGAEAASKVIATGCGILG